MAYNRPKSLDELNSIFDKTVAAEKAIKKNSSKLESGEDGFSSFSEEKAEENKEDPVTTEAPSAAITENVSDFIAKFAADNEPEPVRARPQMTVLAPEAPVKADEEKAESPVYEPEAAPSSQAEKPSRDELFKDYARIMSDEEDDTPSEKKLSRKEKKLLRMKAKADKKAAKENSSAEEPDIEEPAAENFSQEDSTVSDPIIKKTDEGDYGNAAPCYEEPDSEEPSYAESVVEEPSAKESQQGITGEEKDDFDFPEDHIPEWMKEEESGDETEIPHAEKTKSAHTFLKALLSLLLIAVISIGTLATVFKTVVAVNTGKLVSDKYYFFTTYKDYSDLGLSKGDLVITEKKFAEEGEIFAYVDYGSKSFEFGKRTDSITKDDGEVLYVTERDGGRTLVSRDDCKGVIYLTYEGRGSIVSFLTDNYIILVASSVVISLAIILVFALALRTKKNEEKTEDELSAESDEEFEDIFSTID